MKPVVLTGRVIFGAWMLANGLNHFFFALWTMPAGHEPLAAQLMSALMHSRLLDVAMFIELVTGALIVIGFFVPVALCVVMPVSTCALYWALILDHQPLAALLAILAFGLNGVLMLAYIDYYAQMLQRHAEMFNFGEAAGRQSFDLIYVNAAGRSSRGEFVAALITLLAVVAFYSYVVTGRTAQWCVLFLLFPALVLHARRLHDMGKSAWLLVVPGLLLLVAFTLWVHLVSLGTLKTAVYAVALVISAGFALWGCIGAGQPAANRFGSPAAAIQG